MKKTSKKTTSKKSVKTAPKKTVAKKTAQSSVKKTVAQPIVPIKTKPVAQKPKTDIYELFYDLGMSVSWGIVGVILLEALVFSYSIWANFIPSNCLNFDLILFGIAITSLVFYFKRK